MSVEVTGIEQAQEDLKSIADELRNSIGRKAMALGAELLVAPMRALAPKFLRSAIGAELRSYQGGNILFGIVGPKLPEGNAAAVLEKRHPFVQPTFDGYGMRVVETVGSAIGAELA